MTTWELYEHANNQTLKERSRRKYLIEFHKRIGVPFGAFLMSLMAAPLGIFFGRGGISAGICAGLAAFLAYYLALLFGTTVAGDGLISPLFGVWLPNLAFSIPAVLLWKRLSKNGPLLN